MQARDGSTHGYDVVDPTRVSDALGGESGFRALAESGLPGGRGAFFNWSRAAASTV